MSRARAESLRRLVEGDDPGVLRSRLQTLCGSYMVLNMNVTDGGHVMSFCSGNTLSNGSAEWRCHDFSACKRSIERSFQVFGSTISLDPCDYSKHNFSRTLQPFCRISIYRCTKLLLYPIIQIKATAHASISSHFPRTPQLFAHSH